ncbi:hypothetical protein [Thiolapillus sp.]|uniref:hypothetical protein n=1 Tax=Thiolapillus sp. TaxID=2017437 RepID=UPI003AF63D32
MKLQKTGHFLRQYSPNSRTNLAQLLNSPPSLVHALHCIYRLDKRFGCGLG